MFGNRFGLPVSMYISQLASRMGRGKGGDSKLLSSTVPAISATKGERFLQPSVEIKYSVFPIRIELAAENEEMLNLLTSLLEGWTLI
jgi:hypothetical protein